MNETITGVEDRVLERIRKLLRLANDTRGNENEAALAARRATELMEQHGLSTAVVEAGGGVGEGRTQAESESFERGRAPWMSELMRVVADSCFCLCEVEFIGGGRKTRLAFRLYGRESAVAGAFALADYLRDVVWRLSKGAERPHYFRMGCAERLGERVRADHETALANQRAEAERASREAAARAAHPGAAPTGTALSIILEDYAEKEREANEELRRGLPPGTLAALRAAEQAECDERDRRYKRLIDSGVEQGVAWNMAHMNMDLERATAYEAEWKRREATRRVEEEKPRKKTKGDEARERRQFRAYLRELGRRSDPSWVAGREQADEVSLARQLADRKDRRLK